jgi:molybdopterin converting factor small subunit
MARIVIPTALRKFTDNETDFESFGSTVADALGDLVDRYPSLKTQLYDGQNRLRGYINVYVNDADIRTLDRTDTTLEPQAVVSLVPAIAGGTQ